MCQHRASEFKLLISSFSLLPIRLCPSTKCFAETVNTQFYIHKMNPVLILLMVAINEAQWVAAQPVVYQPFGIWSRPVRVLLDVQPPRTRSLPTQSAIGNLAGLLVKKSGETMNGFITNKVRNNDTKSTTVTTTTEWPISVAQPTTVDIETLPGFWLKDPSRIPESTGGGVPYQMDYRTERYRLDDLLLTKKARHDDKETIFSS